MHCVIVDLESCRGTEAPYVMLSHASSLSGALILRPFLQKKIMCPLSQDLCHKNTRLNLLDTATTDEYNNTWNDNVLHNTVEPVDTLYISNTENMVATIEHTQVNILDIYNKYKNTSDNDHTQTSYHHLSPRSHKCVKPQLHSSSSKKRRL